MIILAVQAALVAAAAKVGAGAIDNAVTGFQDLRNALIISRADMAVVESLMKVAQATQADNKKQEEVVAAARNVAMASRDRILRALSRITSAVPDALKKTIADIDVALKEVIRKAEEVLPNIKGALVTHGFVWVLGAGAALFVLYKVFVQKGSLPNG